MVKLGLLGRSISYSFSRGYFNRKFTALGLEDYVYENFDLDQIAELPALLESQPELIGLNVTIPYKEAVIPYLNRLDGRAEKIGAVNTIKIDANGLTGYNTDVYGFRMALQPLLKPGIRQALILGTGGASKAVGFVLQELDIAFTYVSRSPGPGQLGYGDLTQKSLEVSRLIINTTPLGTYPNVAAKPPIPYEYLGPSHTLFDLIYNPEVTAFLKEGLAKGTAISNGLFMLEQQAEKAWEIWSSL